MIQNLYDHWVGWVGAITGLGFLAPFLSFIPGFSIVLSLVASVAQAFAPLVNGILSTLVLFWTEILLPGVINIVTNITTLLTVITLLGGVYYYAKLETNIKNLNSKHNSLERAYTTKEPVQPIQQEEMDLTRLLPWNW